LNEQFERLRFAPLMRERPYGRKSRIAKRDYGKRSETSKYVAERIAEQTLVTRRMSMEDQITELIVARTNFERDKTHKIHSQGSLPRDRKGMYYE
jgi:hypothetical protein